MLLYIFLRGLYSYKQNPTVEYSTQDIMAKLGMSRNTISKARRALQCHGVILYAAAKGGRYKAKYTMLGSVLLPGLYKASCSETAQPAAQKLTPAYNRLTKIKKNIKISTLHVK